MGFRTFIEYAPAASRNSLTIRVNNMLFINETVLNQFHGEYKKFAVICIDEENLKVGLTFFNEKPIEVHRSLFKEKSGVSLNIAAVLRFLKTDKLKKKVTLDFNKENGMLVFSVKDLLSPNQLVKHFSS